MVTAGVVPLATADTVQHEAAALPLGVGLSRLSAVPTATQARWIPVVATRLRRVAALDVATQRLHLVPTASGPTYTVVQLEADTPLSAPGGGLVPRAALTPGATLW